MSPRRNYGEQYCALVSFAQERRPGGWRPPAWVDLYSDDADADGSRPITLDRAAMINRVWKGWTSLENADAYETLLLTEIFPRIAARRIPGFLGIRCDRLNG